MLFSRFSLNTTKTPRLSHIIGNIRSYLYGHKLQSNKWYKGMYSPVKVPAIHVILHRYSQVMIMMMIKIIKIIIIINFTVVAGVYL